jgi:hypothetical protein
MLCNSQRVWFRLCLRVGNNYDLILSSKAIVALKFGFKEYVVESLNCCK